VSLGLRSPNWGDYDYTQSYGFRVLSCANDACLGVEVNDSDDPEILLPDLMEGFAAGDGATRVKLTNTGHSPISNLSLNLPSGEFVLSGTAACVSLAPGASCEFTITPRAGLIRGHYTGQLSLSYGLSQVKLRDIVLVVTPFVPSTPPVIPGPPNTGTPMEQFGITPQTYTLCGLVLLVVIAGLWIAKSRRARRP
jgi:hypothetical protein